MHRVQNMLTVDLGRRRRARGADNHSSGGECGNGSGCKAGPASGPAQWHKTRPGLMACCCILKLFILLEQGALHFYFAQGPANYLCGPVTELSTCPGNNRKGQRGLSRKPCLKWLFKAKQARMAGCGPWASRTGFLWGQLQEGPGLARRQWEPLVLRLAPGNSWSPCLAEEFSCKNLIWNSLITLMKSDHFNLFLVQSYV